MGCPAGCNGGYGTGGDVAKRMLKPQCSFSRQESKLGDVSRMGTSWNEESNTMSFSAPPKARTSTGIYSLLSTTSTSN